MDFTVHKNHILGFLGLFLFLSISFAVGWVVSAPQFAKHNEAKVAYRVPPVEGYTRMVFWLHALTPRKDAAPRQAAITVKNMRVYRESDNALVYEKRYNVPVTLNQGGLFKRIEGWSEEKLEIKNQRILINGDGVRIDMRDYAPYWVHLWSDRIVYRPGERYRMEMLIRIDGEAAVQYGLDYYRGDTDPRRPDGTRYLDWDPTCADSVRCEGAISPWYYRTDGAYTTITFRNY